MVSVVPIFVSTGAAVLPAMLGALGSILAIAVRPREAWRTWRRQTVRFRLILMLAVGACIALGAACRLQTDAKRPFPEQSRSAARYDWARVARAILTQQQSGKRLTTRPPDSSVNTTPETSRPAVVTRPGQGSIPLAESDFSRCGYDGGLVPRDLRPTWEFAPEDTLFLSTPAVNGDRVIVAGCQRDLGGYTGLLACLNRETGRPLWQVTQLGDEPLLPFFSSPAITADGRLIVIGQGLHADRNCALLCFETQTGRLACSVRTPQHIESSPAIRGDLAVVGAGAIEGPDGRPVGEPGFVLAVRISDGRELWRTVVPDAESSPAIDAEGIVYIGSGFNGQAVLALRSETDAWLSERKLNRLVWRVEMDVAMTGAITIVDDLVIAGGGTGDVVHSAGNARGLVVAIERKTGHIRWKRTMSDTVLAPIAARDGLLICPSRSGEVTALAVSNGAPRWNTRISGSAPICAGAALSGDTVFVVSTDGFLAALNAHDGQPLQKLYLNADGQPGSGLSLSSPRVTGGRVLVGSETGGVRCLQGRSQP